MERRVFDKAALIACNNMARVQNYNRVCDPGYLEALPNELFTPYITLLHAHKNGQPCGPHVRCAFNHNGEYFMIDVEMGCWNMLPTVAEVAQRIRNAKNPQPEAAT